MTIPAGTEILSGGLQLTSGLLSPPLAGYYIASVNLDVEASSDATTVECALQDNGVTVVQAAVTLSSDGDYEELPLDAVVSTEPGDQLSVACTTVGVVDATVGAASELLVTQVGSATD